MTTDTFNFTGRKVFKSYAKTNLAFYWDTECSQTHRTQRRHDFNLLAPELFFLILAHPVYKMWIMQEPNTLELWNKLHFEGKKTEIIDNV